MTALVLVLGGVAALIVWSAAVARRRDRNRMDCSADGLRIEQSAVRMALDARSRARAARLLDTSSTARALRNRGNPLR